MEALSAHPLLWLSAGLFVLGVGLLVFRPHASTNSLFLKFPHIVIGGAVLVLIAAFVFPYMAEDAAPPSPVAELPMDIGDMADLEPAAGGSADMSAEEPADSVAADGYGSGYGSGYGYSAGGPSGEGIAGGKSYDLSEDAGDAWSAPEAPTAAPTPGDPSAVKGPAKNGHAATPPRDREMPAMANGSGHDDNYARVRVFYGTDRKATGERKPDKWYGGDRGQFVYGQCEVSIPRDHRLGELEAPSIWRLEFRQNPEKHVVLLSVKEQTRDDFLAALQRRVAASDARQAFVFVHGYNVNFADAARRTAQLAYDLGYDGAPVFYSWPSQGTVAGYPKDETNVRWGMPHLRAFLTDIAGRSGAQSLHLIAHSMGNRALTEALAELTGDAGATLRPVLREVVLTAPDIDAEVFERDLVPKLAALGARITLYASSQDKALLASKGFHGYPRAGDAGDALVVTEEIDTVDATGLDTSLLGHSYFAETATVMSDLFYLVNERKPPAERFALEPVESEAGRYWRFKRR